MRYKSQSEQWLVIDDALTADDFKAVSSYVKREQYGWVHLRGWNPVWRLTDGAPLQGPVVVSHKIDEEPRLMYPTQSDMDRVIECVLNLQADIVPWVGAHEQDWQYFTARPYIYPQEAGLSWHGDAFSYTGSFVYYAHETWNVEWGGELLVMDDPSSSMLPDTRRATPEARRALQPFLSSSGLDNRYLNTALLAEGMGRFILPKPNRLVILSAGSVHAVKKVERAAGNHVRHTIAGHFVTDHAR